MDEGETRSKREKSEFEADTLETSSRPMLELRDGVAQSIECLLEIGSEGFWFKEVPSNLERHLLTSNRQTGRRNTPRDVLAG